MGTEITILVKPGSSSEKIEIKLGEIHISVRAPPDKGKANRAVVKLLSKTLNIPNSEVTIISGLTSRTKVVEIGNLSKEDVLDIIQREIN